MFLASAKNVDLNLAADTPLTLASFPDSHIIYFLGEFMLANCLVDFNLSPLILNLRTGKNGGGLLIGNANMSPTGINMTNGRAIDLFGGISSSYNNIIIPPLSGSELYLQVVTPHGAPARGDFYLFGETCI